MGPKKITDPFYYQTPPKQKFIAINKQEFEEKGQEPENASLVKNISDYLTERIYTWEESPFCFNLPDTIFTTK